MLLWLLYLRLVGTAWKYVCHTNLVFSVFFWFFFAKDHLPFLPFSFCFHHHLVLLHQSVSVFNPPTISVSYMIWFGLISYEEWQLFCVFAPYTGLKCLMFYQFYLSFLIYSGNVIATKLGIRFIAKKGCWYIHTISDLPFFILFRIKSYFTEPHIVREYCSILQNKRLAYTESLENSRVNYVSKKRGDRGWV